MAPHCPVCRELWRIKFYHLLSHLSRLINIPASFFFFLSPHSPFLPNRPPIFQTHIFDLFWQPGLFSFTFSWQSAGPTCGTSVTADEACICKLPTSHPAACQDIGGIKAAAPWQWLRRGAPLSRIRGTRRVRGKKSGQLESLKYATSASSRRHSRPVPGEK